MFSSPFHSGELAVQDEAGVRHIAEKTGQIIGDTFPPVAVAWVRRQKLIAAGGQNAAGEVWATALRGPAGFLHVEHNRLTVEVLPSATDPVLEVIKSESAVGAVILEPPQRRRIRCNGSAAFERTAWTIETREVYGNCPKYIHEREVVIPVPSGNDAPDPRGDLLEPIHKEWIRRSDTLFIASLHAQNGADCSHRGGPPGFVALDGEELVWEDYPGNAMFNTLGNLQVNPACGLVFPDWESGRIMQLTGTAQLVWRGEERELRFRVKAWREGAF